MNHTFGRIIALITLISAIAGYHCYHLLSLWSQPSMSCAVKSRRLIASLFIANWLCTLLLVYSCLRPSATSNWFAGVARNHDSPHILNWMHRLMESIGWRSMTYNDHEQRLKKLFNKLTSNPIQCAFHLVHGSGHSSNRPLIITYSLRRTQWTYSALIACHYPYCRQSILF